MSVLKNFPMKSQLADTTEVNREFDCVPTCLASALQYITGKPFDGGNIKDAVYGRGYTGGTAAAQYVAYCRAHGARLYAVDASNPTLVQDIHKYLAAGKPVIATEPDPYSSNPNFTHVIVFYRDTKSSLTAMDPWNAQPVTKSDAEWTAELLFKEIWIMEAASMPIPQGWSDDGKTLVAPNKQNVVMGFRAHIINDDQWDAGNVPLLHEQAAPTGGTEQLFNDVMLTWNSKDGVAEQHLGPIVLLQANQLASANTTIQTLDSQVANLKAQLATAQGQLPPALQTALSAAIHSMADAQLAAQQVLNGASTGA